MVPLPASLSARSFPFTPACLRQYRHRSSRRWMSTIDTFRSGLPIPLFTLGSKLVESVRRMACSNSDKLQQDCTLKPIIIAYGNGCRKDGLLAMIIAAGKRPYVTHGNGCRKRRPVTNDNRCRKRSYVTHGNSCRKRCLVTYNNRCRKRSYPLSYT